MLTTIKAHAYGNDFLYVGEQGLAAGELPGLARQMCDRHRGIGADGLIVYEPTADGARMRLINADGSPAEVSGNGVRGLAAIIVDGCDRAPGGGPQSGPWPTAGWPASRPVVIDTDAGRKILTLVGRDHGRPVFRAAMGRPERIRRFEVFAAGERLLVAALWMGNPQCVLLGAPLDDDDFFARVGPALEHHPAFPDRTNVELTRVESDTRVRIRIWERGVGPTASSGTGSCAAAVAAAVFGGAARAVDVVAPGGAQRVEWLEDGVYLTGWASVVMRGTWLAPAVP